MSASLERSHQRHPSRKLTKKRREPGMISVNLPERFQGGDDDGQHGETDEEEVQRRDNAFMHQSVFGIIAAAQTRDDFRSIMQQTGSEDESDQEDETTLPIPTKVATPQPESSSAVPKPQHHKRLSQHKLLKSFSGLRPKTLPPRADKRPTMPDRSTLSSASLSRDAPIMSQMLQARANAEPIDPSIPGSSKSRSRASSPDSSSQKTPKALPEALKEIFQFEKPEEVVSEYPCWYLQNVLLQGYLYITQHHVCFYAYMQQRTNDVIKSGHLSKRGKTNPHYRRYWFTLKGTVFSYFTNASTPYFPNGNIDLRYGISAELVPEHDKTKDGSYFSVTTDKRVYHFKADSVPSAKEWVKQLQKVIFRSHNDGDSVKISLPIENILDVEENPVTNFAETVKIRVIDNDDTFAVDEYFFSFFNFGKDALKVLRIMTQDTTAARALAQDTSARSPALSAHGGLHKAELDPLASMTMPSLHETVRATIPNGPPSIEGGSRRSSELIRRSMDSGRRSMERSRSSFDRHRRSVSATSRVSFEHAPPRTQSPMATNQRAPQPSSESSRRTSTLSPSAGRDVQDEDPLGSQILSESRMFTEPTLGGKLQQRRAAASPRRHSRELQQDISQPSSRASSQGKDSVRHNGRRRAEDDTKHASHLAKDSAATTTLVEPGASTSYSESIGGIVRASANPIQGARDIAGILRDQSKKVGTLIGTSPKGYYEKVYGMWAGGHKHYGDADALRGEDHVFDPDDESDTMQAEQRFRDYFALPSSERLVSSFFGHILRVLPLYGKVYIGSTKLCFRSLLPGTRTKFVVSFKDIMNVEKEKGFRFGYSGMVVIIRGHEEIFFEFNTAALRDDCTITILRSLDRIKENTGSICMDEEKNQDAQIAAHENMLLREARQGGYAEHEFRLPRSVERIGPDGPTMLFDDPEASVLDFRPEESLRITCLTIGSRGDVQPYIALCKGLLKEGHKPKIATHAEFEPWVRKHGIDFAPVEGDPAELMRICVDNGMFTPSFLHEANSKFRGFLGSLLTTAWTACQDSDLLVESPSAMGGIHIAEALSIPYFRAFTMPWTRTRAYPHAFAVPNHKMGGAYNYMTYVMFDNIFWAATAHQVNHWRRKDLGLPPTTLDKLQQNKVPFLYNFSPSVVVPPLDFSEWIRVTGYWFLNEASDWTAPQPLLDFIARARADKMPLVYIGFGSVVVPDSKAMTQAIIAAVLKADVRCILSKGWSDRLTSTTHPDPATKNIPEVPLPPSIFQITSAPHDWLFSQIDAAVHHGGAGTTGASLRAGVPTIIRPFFGDQFFFGNRVQDLGVGMHIKRLTENALGKALWIATHDQRMRDKARLLGEQIRSEDGVGVAINCLWRDMEYARTLVKRRDRAKGGAEGAARNQVLRGGGAAGSAGHADVDVDVDVDVHAGDDEAGEESWTFVENEPYPEVLRGRSPRIDREKSKKGNSASGNVATSGKRVI